MTRYRCEACALGDLFGGPPTSCPKCGGVTEIQRDDPGLTVVRMSPWRVERDPQVLRAVGKLGEECAELLKVINRIVIQGINGVDPETGKSNITALFEEIADVYVQCDMNIEHFAMNTTEMVRRMEMKRARMREWLELVKDDV